MTEQDWLMCNNPHPMMRFLTYDKYPHFEFPPYKFLRYCLACYWESGDTSMAEDAERAIKMSSTSARNPENWAMEWCGNQAHPSPAHRCDMIRDMFGDPFHLHLPLWREEVVNVDPDEYVKKYPHLRPAILRIPNQDKLVQKVRIPPSYITQQVLDLANLAIQEVKGKRCDRCKGKGGWHAGYVESMFTSWVKCCECEGRGYMRGYRLDNLTLLAIADMLEENGCPMESKGIVGNFQFTSSGNRITNHLREEGPHYRGCWAIDLILGV